jgi:hypothetical protein
MRGTKRSRSDGVWELRVYVGRDRVTGKPRQKSRTFQGTERQAETVLAKLEVTTASLTVRQSQDSSAATSETVRPPPTCTVAHVPARVVNGQPLGAIR